MRERQVAVSSILGGLSGRIDGLSPYPAEVIDWLYTRADNYPEAVGLHARFTPDVKAAIGLLGQNLGFLRMAERMISIAVMHSVEKTIGEAGRARREMYVVCHPDTAAYVWLRSKEKRLIVPANVTIAVENDEAVKRGTYLPLVLGGRNTDPCHPATVNGLTNMFRDLGIRTKKVFDIEHLATSHPGMSISEAMLWFGGKIDILHLSGKRHRGCTFEEAERYINKTDPELVILEGPLPSSLLWLTQKELGQIKDLYQKLAQASDTLPETVSR